MKYKQKNEIGKTPANNMRFSVNDDRTPSQILQTIRNNQYEAVWKDWDKALW
jgi:hypothetical protein